MWGATEQAVKTVHAGKKRFSKAMKHRGSEN